MERNVFMYSKKRLIIYLCQIKNLFRYENLIRFYKFIFKIVSSYKREMQSMTQKNLLISLLGASLAFDKLLTDMEHIAQPLAMFLWGSNTFYVQYDESEPKVQQIDQNFQKDKLFKDDTKRKTLPLRASKL